MTTTVTVNDPATKAWNAQFAELKARYPHVRDAILTALHILQQDPDISLDDAKAQAAVHGIRITAASVRAAQTLLAKASGAAAPDTVAEADEPTTAAKPRARAPRRQRAGDAGVDAESLIRGVVAKLQNQGNAEADRLREAMRKAITMLQAAVG